MTARLVGLVQDGRRVNAPLGEQVRIGAAKQNDIVITSAGVSRNHARVVRGEGSYWIEDAGSRNGTWLNGSAVTRSLLRHLDVVSLGRVVDLVFVHRDGGAAELQVDERVVRLEWLDGPETGGTREVAPGVLTLGRAEKSGIVISSSAISRTHARIVNDDRGVTIEDLRSANGTAVNGRRIAALTLLRDGDVIELGACRLRVRIERVEPPKPPDPDQSGATAAAQAAPPQADQEWRTRIIWPGEAGPVPRPAPATVYGGRVDFLVPMDLETRIGQNESSASRTVYGGRPDLAVPPGIGAENVKTLGPAKAGPYEGDPLPVPSPPEGTIYGAPPLMLGVPSDVLDAALASDLPDTPKVMTSSWTLPLTGVRLSGDRGVFTLPPGESTIGRAPDSTVRLDSRDVSRLHATIVVTSTEAIVEDKGSTNGTTVNGKAQKGPCRVGSGDRVAFGDAEFRVELLSEGDR